jgi:hypothetical protein
VYFAEDPVPHGLGLFFARLFATNGWRQLEANKPVYGLTRPELNSHSFCMMFFLRDPHQTSTAKQSIDEVFAKYGFEPVGDLSKGEHFGPEHGFRVFLTVGRAPWPV